MKARIKWVEDRTFISQSLIVFSYSDLRDAISMEKRYFTSDLSNLS